MTKTLGATTLLALFALATGPALAASQADAAQDNPSTARYWLHPKLGMVRIDQATHARVTAQPQPADAAAQNAVGAPAAPEAHATRYWLHPKLGMVRVDAATNSMVTSAGR